MLRPREESQRSWPAVLPGLIAALVLGAAIRLLLMDREGLDGDELFSFRMATLPLGKSLEEIKYDLVHPPLYYLLLRVALVFAPHTAAGMRLLSILAGLAGLSNHSREMGGELRSICRCGIFLSDLLQPRKQRLLALCTAYSRRLSCA
jgi:hypothetical protein